MTHSKMLATRRRKKKAIKVHARAAKLAKKLAKQNVKTATPRKSAP